MTTREPTQPRESDNDDAPRAGRVSLREITTERGSRVAVGFVDETAEVFIRFTNNQGKETPLLLSQQAADALLLLLDPKYPKDSFICRLIVNGVCTELVKP